MAYTGAEAKQLNTELRNSFSQLRSDAEFRYRLAQARHADDIKADLKAAQYKTIVPLVSREVGRAANVIVGILGSPEYEVHVEAKRSADKKRADQLEVTDAHRILQWDRGGRLMHQIRRHMALSPYAAIQLIKTPYNLPKRKAGESEDDYNKRVDEWRDAYTQLSLHVPDPLSFAFLEDDLDVTVYVQELEKPIAEFVRDYGSYDREEYASLDRKGRNDLLLDVFGKQFENIRSGYGWAPDGGVTAFSSQQKVKLCVTDDGTKIAYYVDYKNTQAYSPVGDMAEDGGWDNPFGRPSLKVVPGRWNPEAVLPEDRYQPILINLMQSRYNKDVMMSQLASRHAELPAYVAPLPPETVQTLATMDDTQRANFLKDGTQLESGQLRYAYGKPDKLDAEPSAYFEKMLAEHDADHLQYVPNAAFSGSDAAQSLLKNTPTSSILRMNEIEDQEYDDCFRFLFKALLECLEDSDTCYKADLDDDENGERYEFTTVGKELASREVKGGERFKMAQSDFSFPFERTIVKVDRRASTVSANLDVIRQRMLMPDGQSYVTPEEVVTVLGRKDASAYLQELRIVNRYMRVSQINESLGLAEAVREMEVTYGIDRSMLLAQGAIPQETAQGGGGGSGETGGGYSMAPPSRDSAPVEVRG